MHPSSIKKKTENVVENVSLAEKTHHKVKDLKKFLLALKTNGSSDFIFYICFRQNSMAVKKCEKQK